MANTKIPVELSSTPGIVDNSNATAITIDSSENLIMTAGGTIRAGGANDLILDAGESGTPDIYLQSGGSTKVKIEGSNGNVGIGTGSPAGVLHANSSGHTKTYITGGTSNDAQINFGDSDDNDIGGIHYDNAQNSMKFLTNTTERMRIASDGDITQTGGINDSIIFTIKTSATNDYVGQIKFDDNSGTRSSIMSDHYNNALIFKHNSDIERMRIDSSGRLMVNQTSASAAGAGVKMQINSDILSTGTTAGYFWENRSGIAITSLGGWGGWYSIGTTSHFLYSDGSNIVSINRSSGAYTALSDRNKKKDFEDSTVGLAEVMQLQPKKFRMLDDADDAPKKLGFIAQDVENVIPEAYVEDLADDENEETFIGLTDRPIIAALTKAIQEQQAQIDALQSEINLLKGE